MIDSTETVSKLADVMEEAPDPGGWRVGMMRDEYMVLAQAIVDSDWFSTLLAGTRREALETAARALEEDANHPRGSINHRAYAGHFAEIVRGVDNV